MPKELTHKSRLLIVLKNLFRWICEVSKESIAPKNIANGLILSLVVVIFGSFLGWVIPNYLTPKPILSIECATPDNSEKFFTIKNSGNQSADEAFAHFLYTEQCAIVGFSPLQSWQWENPANPNHLMAYYPLPKTQNPYTFESLIRTAYISPNYKEEFQFADCPVGMKIKLKVWAKNNSLVEKEC